MNAHASIGMSKCFDAQEDRTRVGLELIFRYEATKHLQNHTFLTKDRKKSIRSTF